MRLESTHTILVTPPVTKHPDRATASSYLANLLLQYAARVGIEPRAVCAATNLAAETLTDPAARLPLKAFNALWNEVAQRTGDPDFGLHFAQAADRLAAGNLLQAVLLNCATVGSALEKLARYHGLTTDAVHLRVEVRGNTAHCRLEPAPSELPLQRHHTEAMVASLAAALQRLTQDQARFAAVWFAHAAPADSTEHERLFRCPVHFGQVHTELQFSRAVLAWPVALANASLLEKLEPLAQAMLARVAWPGPWASQVAAQISQSLLQGERPALDTVAQALALGPRQLQNKLKAEGLTFQRVLDTLRKEAALSYLQDSTRPLCDIAFLLGFAEQSTFNHAFKRWTGVNPRDYQRHGLPSPETL